MSAEQPGAQPGTPTKGDDEYVITSLGAPAGSPTGSQTGGQAGSKTGSQAGGQAGESSAALATRTSRFPAIIEESPFAREVVIHAASFVYGVRRAVAPETIFKVRAEMKRELKRARKARKAEVKAALKEYRARHRADVPTDGGGNR